MAVSRIGKYENVREIGSGTSGVCNLVRDTDDGNLYILKSLDMTKFSQKDLVNAMAEVTILKTLNHPNIVEHHESWVDEEQNFLFIVMEYADGGDLNEIVKEQRKKRRYFTKDVVMNWFVQICLAVKHMHDRRIMHRDIKLQNIFVTSEGVIKLGDFGLTCVLRDSLADARTCLGTPYYMSPELCASAPYNYKSDIWALGCVLYKLCALQHAFPAQTFKELSRAIMNDPTPPLPHGFGKRANRLVQCLLLKDPQERPRINEVLQASILRSRIEQVLPPDVYEEEMSHTVLRPAANDPTANTIGGEDHPSGPAIDTTIELSDGESDSDDDPGQRGEFPQEEDDTERAFGVLKSKLEELNLAEEEEESGKSKSKSKSKSKAKKKRKAAEHVEGLQELRSMYEAQKANKAAS